MDTNIEQEYNASKQVSDSKRRDVGAIVHVLSAVLIPFSLGLSIMIPAFLYVYHNYEYSKGPRDEFLVTHLREALNANVTFLFAAIIHGLLSLILVGIITGLIHWLALVAWSFSAQKALESGDFYRYPFTFRLF